LRDSNTAATGKTLDEDDATTWDPIDLTAQTVRVHFRDLGGDAILDTMTCGKSEPYADGKCFMQWTATPSGISVLKNLDAGTYEGEIELEDTSGRKQTIFDKLKFKVRADFD
jgi:hypothetical protein